MHNKYGGRVMTYNKIKAMKYTISVPRVGGEGDYLD